MSLFYHRVNSNKKIIYYFTQLYGISFSRSKILISKLGIDFNSTFKDLTFEDKRKLDHFISTKLKYKLHGDLKKSTYDSIKLLRQIKTYRGIRHVLNLSVNGQNTKTNAKTQKWKRKK